MAFKLQSGNGKSGNIKRVGHIALAVEEFDTEKNAVSGYDISSGESVTVRMPSTKEFAALFVNRDRFDTEEKRLTEAARQTRKQPTAASMAEKVKEGGVMQMQNVVRDNNDDLVARWANAVITDPSNQAAMSAMIEVNKPRDDKPDAPRRSATIVQVDEAFVPSPEKLDAVENLLSNNKDGGMAFNFEAKTGVTVAVSTEEESKGFRLMTGWDADEKASIQGLEANVTRQPYDFREANAQTLLAAKAGIPFEQLSAPEKQDGYDAEYLSGLYEAVQNGDVDVSVAPTIQGNLMPFVRDRIIDSELRQDEGKGARLSNRGYFEAHIGLEQGKTIEDSNDRYPTGVREVAATGFLRATNDEKFTPVWGGEIAARIADAAATKQEAELEAAKKMQNEQERSRTAGQEFGQPAM